LFDFYSNITRPRTEEVTLSLLKRAKSNGFKALVVTLDTMTLGWRPHDLASSYLPFGHGLGIAVGRSDPVFMGRYNRRPIFDEQHEFPYDPVARDKLYLAGDEATKEAVFFGTEWLQECNSGVYKSWEDLKFLRDNWEGPLVLKGIQSVLVCVRVDNSSSADLLMIDVTPAQDAEKALEYGVDGIIISNHGMACL
jgi:isopentenyl diphosphate isomerase/L-lactate dehydrogenase-like FMN-dependent dehydrogenase